MISSFPVILLQTQVENDDSWLQNEPQNEEMLSNTPNIIMTQHEKGVNIYTGESHAVKSMSRSYFTNE